MTVVRSGYQKAISEICSLPFWFAVFPFRFHDDRLTISPTCLVLSVVFVSLLVCHSALLTWKPGSFYSSNFLIYLVYVVQHCSIRFTLYITIFWLAKNRSLLNKMIKLLGQIDLFLACDGSFWRYSVNYVDEIVTLTFILFLAINHGGIRSLNLWKFSKVVAYYSSMACLFVTAIQFKRFVLYLSSGLTNLKKSLFSINEKFNMSTTKLEPILIKFDSILMIISILNQVYNPQILMMIFCSFLISTANIYFFYQSLLMAQGAWENILRLGWAIAFFYLCYIIVSPCVVIAKEAKEFNTLLYQLMIDDKTNEIANNKKLRLHIAMKREVVFTACGFFTLDYSLVHSMVAAATTYLVILIQFSQPVRPVVSQDTQLAPTLPAFANSTG